MPLSAGTRLGHYEIVAPLGAGGMGEVYRAKDVKLGREVAIKILADAVSTDPERLGRFRREAQVLASLNHPNIGAIYGLDEADGKLFLVLELVAGDDLSKLMKQGPIPLDDTLAIARQIVEALEEAHDKGIVHRDLKPANIKLAPGGKVKVLDFGLAKAYASDGSAPGSSDSANSPTMTHAATMAGMILGTAAYMSPEQARGKSVDARADIWAFGVVLYEMLTGEGLFEGETAVDTLSAVMRKDIDLGRLPASTPRKLRELLHRCLERNPRNRLHHIADARIVLDELIAGGSEDDPAPIVAPAAPRTSRAALIAALAGGALLLAAGVGTGWLMRRPAPAVASADARWALGIPEGYTLSVADDVQVAISDDGRLQAVVVLDEDVVSHLLLRSQDDPEPKLLPDTAGAHGPFFSPDGSWIGFVRGRGLYKMPTVGGAPVELASTSLSAPTRGATWGRDGVIYFTPTVTAGLSRVSENGGPVTAVTTLDAKRDERTHRWPQVIPEGDAVLFTCDTFGSTEFYDDARIEAVRPSTGERHVLVEGASLARAAPGGRLVFARAGSLYSVAFDPRTLTTHGTPEKVMQGVASDIPSGAVEFAVSASGAATWIPGSPSARYALVWVDRSGVDTPVAIPTTPYNEAELSPDGKRVALVGGEGGAADLWVADLDRGTQTRLTMKESVLNPVWTRDGRQIVYVRRLRGDGGELRWRILREPADGSRDAETLLDAERFLSPSGFTPDGKKLIYSGNRDATGADSDIFMLPLEGSKTPEVLLGGPGFKRDAIVSPDGRWFAYTSTEAEQPTVYVRPFPAGEGRWQISTPGGFEPRWGPDGTEIFYRSTGLGGTLYRVAIETKNGFTAGKPERFLDRVSNAGQVHTYSPSPDGRRVFTPRTAGNRGSMRIVYFDLGFARRLGARSSSPRE